MLRFSSSLEVRVGERGLGDLWWAGVSTTGVCDEVEAPPLRDDLDAILETGEKEKKNNLKI